MLGHLLTLLRHLAVAGQGEERAQFGFARREHRIAVFGLPVHEPTQAKVDAALQLFLFAVAVGAVLLEDRADLRLVVRHVRRTQSRGGDEQRAQQEG